jgi:hypothetical protein
VVNGHELVQGWLADDGVEGLVDHRDVKDDALRAVVLRHPEYHRDRDAAVRDDGARARSQKLA